MARLARDTTSRDKEDSPQQHRHLSRYTDYSDKGCPLYPRNNLGLVIAGYWDKVAGINLLHLVGLWREAQLDEETLSEQYPDAAEYFKIRVMSSGENKYIRDILPDFEGCPHIKIWCMGSDVNWEQRASA